MCRPAAAAAASDPLRRRRTIFSVNTVNANSRIAPISAAKLDDAIAARARGRTPPLRGIRSCRGVAAMSKREFSKVSPALWRSGRFTGLECSTAQVLYLYFLSCEHQNSAGCFRLPDGYACSDLGWSLETYQSARDKLITAELITVDLVTAEIYVDRWLKHNPPMNEKPRNTPWAASALSSRSRAIASERRSKPISWLQTPRAHPRSWPCTRRPWQTAVSYAEGGANGHTLSIRYRDPTDI
jgi:hypothetical protein